MAVNNPYNNPSRTKSPEGSDVNQPVFIVNQLPFNMMMFVVSDAGQLWGAGSGGTFTAGSSGYPIISPSPQPLSPVLSSFPGGAWLAFFTVSTGGLAVLYELPASASGPVSVTLTSALFCPPNRLGQVPQPGHRMLIPPDSQRIVVGSGTSAGNSFILREQYWKRLPDSYSIASGQERTVSFTVVEGMQSVSSSQDTVSSSLGVSASGGWGPISASVSASLSKTSTTYQQLTLTSETTTYVSETLKGPASPGIAMYIYWQLMDVISIVSSSNQVLAQIVSGQKPIILAGPYNPADSVWVTPPSANAHPAQQIQFTAELGAAQNAAVAWSVKPSTAGSINDAGLYTAPGTIAQPTTAFVTATGIAHPALSNTAVVRLVPSGSSGVPEAGTASGWAPPQLSPQAVQALEAKR